MTDKDIIKALECCKPKQNRNCGNCPAYELGDFCAAELKENALDLINRQQAEIERLKIKNQSLRGTANFYKFNYNEARTEAIKEFAERLKAKCHNYYPSIDSYCVSVKAIGFKDIDNLVKEMVGEDCV